MNNTQKILVAIGVGVGVAFIYNRYKKGKPTTGSNATIKNANVTLELPEKSATADMTREEKEEYILDKVSATPQEVSSGFEGVRFVWNPKIGKMYPVGTIVEGEEPSFGEIFNQAEGTSSTRMANPKNQISETVLSAEKILQSLDEQELNFVFEVVKRQNENPSISSEEEVIKEMGITNPSVVKKVRQLLKKTLNDIKALKTDSVWSQKWNARKEVRLKRRSDFKGKMGFDKGIFDKQVRKTCGLSPRLGKGNKANYKKCVQTLADKMRSQAKLEVATAVANAPISEKDMINNARQKSFSQQVTNRTEGGMFAGHRWDGESNKQIESLVDAGLV
jgi:hypothetical protein